MTRKQGTTHLAMVFILKAIDEPRFDGPLRQLLVCAPGTERERASQFFDLAWRSYDQIHDHGLELTIRIVERPGSVQIVSQWRKAA